MENIRFMLKDLWRVYHKKYCITAISDEESKLIKLGIIQKDQLL